MIEKVSGARRIGFIYISESYMYKTASKVSRGVRSVKCVVEECRGTGCFKEGDSEIRVVTPHNHPPDRDEEDLVKFRHQLRLEAGEATLAASTIYNEQAPKFPYGAALLPYNEGVHIVRTFRASNIPPNPRTLMDLSALLNCPTWRGWTLACDTRWNMFFKRTVFDSHEPAAVLFESPQLSALLEDDGCVLYISFTPFQPNGTCVNKVLMVGVCTYAHSQWDMSPVGYAYFRESNPSVRKLKIAIEALVDPTRNISFVVGYGVDLKEAVGAIWSTTQFVTCHFNYAEDITNIFILSRIEEKEENVKHLRRLMALPLVPPGMLREALLNIKSVAPPVFQTAVEHVTAYIMAVGTAQFSIYNDTLSADVSVNEVNSAIQRTCSQLYHMVRDATPALWTLTDSLRQFDHSSSKRLEEIRRRPEPVAARDNVRRSTRVTLLNDTIKALQTNLLARSNGVNGVGDFLDRAETVLKTYTSRVLSEFRLMRPPQIVNAGQAVGVDLPVNDPAPAVVVAAAVVAAEPVILQLPILVNAQDGAVHVDLPANGPAPAAVVPVAAEALAPVIPQLPQLVNVQDAAVQVDLPANDPAPAAIVPAAEAAAPVGPPLPQLSNVQDGAVHVDLPANDSAPAQVEPAAVVAAEPVIPQLPYVANVQDAAVQVDLPLPVAPIPIPVIPVMPPAAAAQLPQGGHVPPPEIRICCICMERPANIFMEPCGHLCICVGCQQEREQQLLHAEPEEWGHVNHSDCPICKSVVIKMHRIF